MNINFFLKRIQLRSNIDEQLTAISPSNGIAEQTNNGQKLNHWMKAYSVKGSQYCTFVVADENGEPIFDHAKAAKCLADHCAPLFAAKPRNSKKENLLLTESIHFPEGASWDVSDEDVHNILIRNKRSATGPNGIPYTAYKAILNLCMNIFKGLSNDILNGFEVPDNFNDARIAVIDKLGAKGAEPGPRKPKDGRYLTPQQRRCKDHCCYFGHSTQSRC